MSCEHIVSQKLCESRGRGLLQRTGSSRRDGQHTSCLLGTVALRERETSTAERPIEQRIEISTNRECNASPSQPSTFQVLFSLRQPGTLRQQLSLQGTRWRCTIPLPCQNCGKYGHPASQCPEPAQARTPYKQVEILPREQTALNYGSKTGIENPDS